MMARHWTELSTVVRHRFINKSGRRILQWTDGTKNQVSRKVGTHPAMRPTRRMTPRLSPDMKTILRFSSKDPDRVVRGRAPTPDEGCATMRAHPPLRQWRS